MRCDICKGEIKIGGSYFIDKAGKNVCERTCFPDLNIGYINLPETAKVKADIEPEPVTNQCDGCWRVLPIANGVHFDPEDNNRSYMACQAHLYEKEEIK